MKKILSAIAIGGGFILALVSCSLEENTMNPVPSDPRVPMTFYAGSEDDPADAGKDTKTSFHPEDGAVYWSELDTIRVFDGSSYDNAFSIDEGYGTSTGKFSGLAVPGAETYYALYPYSSEAWFFGNKISSVLPGEQTYTAGTFATKLNPSVAKTAGDENSFLFHNVASIIQVTNEVLDKTVKEITVNAPSIAGGFIVDMSGDTFAAEPVADTTSLSAVTLSAAVDDALGAGPYYIVVLPGTYATLDVVVTFTDGTIAGKSYTNLEVPAGGGRSVTVKDEDIVEGTGYYAIYQAGGNIEIAGKVYNKSEYGDAALIKTGETLSTISAKVNFLEDNVTLNIAGVSNLILVGNDPEVRSNIGFNNYFRLNSVASNDEEMVLFNLSISPESELTAAYYSVLNTKEDTFNYICLDNCDFNVSKNIIAITTNDTRSINDIKILNSDFFVPDINAGTGQRYIIGSASGRRSLNSLVVNNNIFYSSDAGNNNFKLIQLADADLASFELKNNIFYNLEGGSNNFYCWVDSLKTINAQYNIVGHSVNNRLSNSSIVRCGSFYPTSDIVQNNVSYHTGNYFCNFFYYNSSLDINPEYNEMIKNTDKITTSPFAETSDFASGKFVMVSEYASYGAQR